MCGLEEPADEQAAVVVDRAAERLGSQAGRVDLGRPAHHIREGVARDQRRRDGGRVAGGGVASELGQVLLDLRVGMRAIERAPRRDRADEVAAGLGLFRAPSQPPLHHRKRFR